jgi:DNA-binding transcriptional LysR family regulator
MIELNRLHQIAVLAEARSFIRAARILGISQPSLSRSIQDLEGQLGVQLFNRASPQLAPSEICVLILEKGEEILKLSKELSDLIERRRRLEMGQVSVGTGMYAKHVLMDAIISTYVASFPNVQLELKSSNWTVCRELLKDQKIDVFIGEAEDEVQNPLFDYHYLRRRQGYIVVRRDHPLTKIADLSFDHVARYPLAGTKIPRRLFKYFPSSASLGEVDPREAIFDPHFEGYLWEDMVTIVASTDAVAFGTPASISKYDGLLVCLDLLLPWLHNSGAIIWRADAGPSPEVDAFIKIARAVDESI